MNCIFIKKQYGCRIALWQLFYHPHIAQLTRYNEVRFQVVQKNLHYATKLEVFTNFGLFVSQKNQV